jgi:hypothetical protein
MARPLAVLLRARRQTANLGAGARGRCCVATSAVRGDRALERGEALSGSILQGRRCADATAVSDCGRARRGLAGRAAKIGGMAWIVRTALDGLGGFFGPYEMFRPSPTRWSWSG